MFERFTDRARIAVHGAQDHAHRLGHPYIGTEHLLLALADGDGVAARALTQVGFDRRRFEQAVLEEVGRKIVAGGAALPHTPRVKKALEVSLHQSLAMGHDYIGTEHILLGLLEDDGALATKLVVEQGILTPAVQAAIARLLVNLQQADWSTATSAAAGGAESVEALQATAPSTTAARCPGCREPLAPNLGADVIASVGEVERAFTVAYCRACGHILAVLPDDAGGPTVGPVL
jgi:ATP-dependent Clp protease ATP-binding subunit ClpC